MARPSRRPNVVHPWENGYVESFNGKLRDELLNGELFLSLAEARWVIDRWRLDYNHRRPHSSLDYQTPATYAVGCVLKTQAWLLRTPARPISNDHPDFGWTPVCPRLSGANITVEVTGALTDLPGRHAGDGLNEVATGAPLPHWQPPTLYIPSQEFFSPKSRWQLDHSTKAS